MKKQRKRWISVLLMFALCAGMLAACNQPSSGGESGGEKPGQDEIDSSIEADEDGGGSTEAGTGDADSSTEAGTGDINSTEGSNGNISSNIRINKDAVYQGTALKLDVEEEDEIKNIILSGDVMYVITKAYDGETGGYVLGVYSADRDGSDMKKIYERREISERYPEGAEAGTSDGAASAENPEKSDGSADGSTGGTTVTREKISDLVGDGQGNLLEVVLAETETEKAHFVSSRIVKLDRDGKELWAAEVEDAIYLNGVICGGGHILAYRGNTVYVFDENGQRLNKISADQMYSIYHLVALKDGRVYGGCYKKTEGESSEFVLAPLDLQTGRFGEAVKPSWLKNEFTLTQGVGYDLFLKNNLIVAGYNIGDENYTEVLNFVDSDIDAGTKMRFLCPSGENKFLAGIRRAEDGVFEVQELNKVDPADVKEKTIITLGMTYNDFEMISRVVKFNQSNDEYRIKMIFYNDYNTRTDQEAGLARLRQDIADGKAPDILLPGCLETLFDSYAKKGVFEDLYTWIDQDPEMNREDFMPNVMEAFTVDGKLLQVTPGFAVRTLAGKASIVGDTPGWTMEEMIELAEKYPESRLIFGWMGDAILSDCISYGGSRFIHDGVCDFDSEEFIRLLEWVNAFSKRSYSSYAIHTNAKKAETMYRDDQVLLKPLPYVTSFWDFKYAEEAVFGEPVTFIGYPAPDGSGAVLETGTTYAISANSKHKEGAWEFVRGFLTEEYQTSREFKMFPIRISALQEMGRQEMKPRTYLDENGNEVAGDTYRIGDQEYVIAPPTQEEIDGYIEYMKTVNREPFDNYDIMKIITEEAEAFFDRKQSAKAAAESIQRRVKLVLDENS